MRGLSAVVVGTLLSVALLGCGARQHPGEPTRLSVVTEPENTRIRIDDRDAGSARVMQARPPRLTPGRHQISIEADGYFPHDVELDLPPGTTTLRVQLRPIPR